MVGQPALCEESASSGLELARALSIITHVVATRFGELGLVEIGVQTSCEQQLRVGSALNNRATANDQDFVRVTNG